MLNISIVVPVYRIDESLLRSCIESLENQTCSNYEIILVDDGSPDSCGIICDEYAASNSKIKVIHTENKGVSNARNEGIKASSGEYIMFVDGDDYIEKETCKKCFDAMIKYDPDLVMIKMYTDSKKSTKIFDSQNICLKDLQIDDARRGIMSHVEPFPGYIMGSPCMKLYKKSIILDNDLRFVLGLKKCQDRVFNFDYFQYVQSIILLDYEGYHYVVNENSVTNKYNPNIINILGMAKQEFKKRISFSNHLEKNAYYLLCVRFFGEILHLDILNKNNNESLLLCIKRIKNLVSEEDYREAIKNEKLNLCGKKNAVIIGLIKLKLYCLATILGMLFNN